jgi:iron complex outermembrane recepter protein
MIAGTASAQEQIQPRVEEMVVTGSYIRRDTFDMASPVSVIDSTDIAEQGTAHMADIIKNQTFVFGTDFLSNSTASTFQNGTVSSANLRGLGAGATLTLLDGRRLASGNVNTLLPQIAIARMEILKDGGAALYGTDAVAGVINVIPRKGFEGLAIEGNVLSDQDGTWGERTVQLMGGTGNEDTHITAAFEYRDRDRLRQQDRPMYMRNGWSHSGVGNPGTYLVPTRNAQGQLTGSLARTPDPACGIDPGAGTDKALTGNNRSGIRAGTTCQLEFGEFLDYITQQEAWQSWVHGEHRLADWLRLEGELMFGRVDTLDRGSPANPGGRINELPAIRGEFPGNPFRAMANRGSGLEPIFARDANGDGMPDRDANGVVILADNPFDAAGGVPFNEDVQIAALRLVGKIGTPPSTLHPDGSNISADTRERYNFRWSSGVRFDVPETTWSGTAFYTYHQVRNDQRLRDESLRAAQRGLEGRLGPNNDEYFNIFGTQEYTCLNRVCDPNSAASHPNSQYVMDEIAVHYINRSDTVLKLADVVVTGDVYQLPAGMLSAAVGGQWRRLDAVTDVGSIANACDRFVGGCGYDFDHGRTTHAVFGELAVPLLSGGRFGELDMQLAVRHEDSGSGLDSTDPKVSLRYQPTDWVALRGSWGTSFIAPSLGELHVVEVSFIEQMVDTTCTATGACPTGSTAVTQTFGGNPNLRPEDSTAINLGIAFDLLDGDLRFSVDWMRFDFSDRISRTRGQDILDQDRQRFGAFLAANNCAVGDPVCGAAVRAQWIDPTNKATGNFEAQAIRRTADGDLLDVRTSYVNAQEMTWKGLDFNASYRWDASAMPYIGGNYGSFALSLSGTYVDSYRYQLTLNPNEVCPGTTRPAPCEGAGKRNDRTSVVPPIPRLRANARLGWTYDRHSVALMTRYMDGVLEDSVFAALTPTRLSSMTTFDLQYTLSLTDLIGRGSQTTLTLGGNNIFDRKPRAIVGLGGLETFLHDPRGAIWYARLSHQI